MQTGLGYAMVKTTRPGTAQTYRAENGNPTSYPPAVTRLPGTRPGWLSCASRLFS